MEVHFFKRLAVNLGLGLGYAFKDAQACMLDHLGQVTLRNDGLDIGKVSVRQMAAMAVLGAVTVVVIMLVTVVIMVSVTMTVRVLVVSPVIMGTLVGMVEIIRMFTVAAVFIIAAAKPHMHLHTLNAAALLWLTLQAKLVLKAQLGKLGLKILWADAKIDHGGKIHVATDSGKAVVIKNLHKTPVKLVQPGTYPVVSAAVCPSAFLKGNIEALPGTRNSQYDIILA